MRWRVTLRERFGNLRCSIKTLIWDHLATPHSSWIGAGDRARRRPLLSWRSRPSCRQGNPRLSWLPPTGARSASDTLHAVYARAGRPRAAREIVERDFHRRAGGDLLQPPPVLSA